MSFGLLRNSASLAAIDFGASSLKAIQVELNERPTLVAAGALEVPEEIASKPAERFAFQSANLAKLLKDAGIRAKRGVCSVSAASTVVQHLRVTTDQGALRQQVEQQVQLRFGFAPSRVIIRSTKVRDVTEGGQKLMEAVCTLMPRDAVLAHMQALKGARLEPAGVHSEHAALARLFDALAPEGGPPRMFVDLGRATTKLVVLDAGNAVVQRTIAIGGVDIEAGLCKREQEPISRARALRKVEGEDNAYEGEPTVAALADELRLGTRHHHALFPDRELESVVFAGGEAWDEPLCRRLGAALGLTTRIADPLATLARGGRTDASGVDLDQPQPAWAVPLGLCLAPTDA